MDKQNNQINKTLQLRILYNNGMKEEKKDFKQLRLEKELAKIVVRWDIQGSNVQKDREK